MEYKLNDKIILEYETNIKINSVDYYQYSIKDKRVYSSKLYFNKLLDINKIDKDKLANYILDKVTTSNNENIIVNLDNFAHENSGPITSGESGGGGGESTTNKPNKSYNNVNANLVDEGFVLLSKDKFNEALNLVKNANQCGNLMAALTSLNGHTGLSGSGYAGIANDIIDFKAQINGLANGYGPTAFFYEYNRMYSGILDGIVLSEIAKYELALDTGLLKQNQASIDKFGDGIFAKDLKTYFDGISSGKISVKDLDDFYGSISEIQNKYNIITENDAMIFLDAANLTENSEELKDMSDKEKKEFIENRNAQLNELYNHLNKTLGITRDAFDQMLDNNLAELAKLISDASMKSADKVASGDDSLNIMNDLVDRMSDLWFSTDAGQQALLDKFINESNTKFDEYNSIPITNYIQYCMVKGKEHSWLMEDLKKFSNVVSKIDVNDNFTKKITVTDAKELDNIKAYIDMYNCVPYGYEESKGANGETVYKRKEYTKTGEDLLYYMDYHCGENDKDPNDKKIITAFSNRGKLDAYQRNYKGAWINSQVVGNYVSETQKQAAMENAERDYNILNGIIEDDARKQELIKAGYLSFEQLTTFVNNNNIDLELLSDAKYIEENKEFIMKETGLNEAQLYNFAITGNINITGDAYLDSQAQSGAILASTIGIAGLQALSGIDKFFENVGDAAKTAVKSDFILNTGISFDEMGNLYFDFTKNVELTKEFKDYQDKIWENHMNSSLYKEQFDNFKKSGEATQAIKSYYDKYLFNPLTGEYKALDGKICYSYDDIPLSAKESLLHSLYKQSKLTEWNLNDSSSSNYYLGAFKEGIRNGGDFTTFDDLDSKVVENAKEQFETINEVSVDKAGVWWDENVYNKDWYNTMESFSFVKHDNILGMTANQIGNMVIPVALSLVPGVGQALSSGALFTSAFGGAAEEAFVNGASYNEALNYATLSAGTEIAIEKVFSGIAGFGEGWADKVIDFVPNKLIDAAGLKDNLLTQTVKSLITGGIGEGIEEIATDFVTPLWQSLTYMNEQSYYDILSENVSLDSLKQTFLVSFLSSMVFGASEVRQKTKHFNKQILNLTNEIGDIPGFKEQADEVLADIIGYDGEYLTTDIITKVIENNAKKIELNPESTTALKKLQQKLSDAYQDLTKNTVELETKDGKTKISKELIMNINDITGLSKTSFLKKTPGVTIDENKVTFKDTETQNKFISAVYSNASNVLNHQLVQNNEAIKQYENALKLNENNTVNLDDLISAIEVLKELGDKSNLSNVMGSVTLEINGNDVTVPTSVVHEITTKYNVKDGKIAFIEENMNTKEFTSKILSSAILKLNLKNLESLKVIENFNGASTKGDIKLLEQASDIIGNNLDTYVVNSIKVDGQDLIKLEVKTNVNGEYRNVNIYIDSSTSPTVYTHNELLTEKIQQLINENFGKENIYLGLITYDKKNNELILKQNNDNNSYVENIKTSMSDENLSMYAYEYVDGNNKGKINIYLDLETDISILKNNNINKKINEIIVEEKKSNPDVKDVYIGKIELKNGQAKITKNRGQKAFVGSKTENIITTERSNLSGTNLIKVDTYVTIDGKTEKVNAYLDTGSNTSILSEQKTKDKILEIIIEEKKNKSDTKDIYVGEILKDKKSGNIIAKSNNTSLEQFRSILVASAVVSGTNTINTTNTTTTNTTTDSNNEIDSKTEVVTDEIVIDTKNIITASSVKPQIDNFIENIEKPVKEFVLNHKNETDFNMRLEQLKVKTSIELNDVIVKAIEEVNSSYNEVIEQINKKLDSLNENDSQIEVLKEQIDSLSKEREEEIRKIREYDTSKIEEIFNSIDTHSDVNVNDVSLNLLSINEIIKKTTEQMNLFIEKIKNECQRFSETSHKTKDNLNKFIKEQRNKFEVKLEETKKSLRESYNKKLKEINEKIKNAKDNNALKDKLINIKNELTLKYKEQVKNITEKSTAQFENIINNLKEKYNNFIADNNRISKNNLVSDNIKLQKNVAGIKSTVLEKYLNNKNLLLELSNQESNFDNSKLIFALKTTVIMQKNIGIELDKATIKIIDQMYNDNIYDIVRYSINNKLSKVFFEFEKITEKTGNIKLSIIELEKQGYKPKQVVDALLSTSIVNPNINSSRKLYNKSFDYLVEKGYSKEESARIVGSIYQDLINKKGFETISTKEGYKIHIQRGINFNNQAYTIDYIQNEIFKLKNAYKTDFPIDIYVYDTFNPNDKYWEIQYKMKDFKSAATGGNNTINIYQNYEISESTLKHEFGHLLDTQIMKDLKQKGRFANSEEWLDAMKKDGHAPTGYAETNSVEDFAESLAYFLMNPKQFKRQFANRYNVLSKYIDSNAHQNVNAQTQILSTTNSINNAITEVLGEIKLSKHNRVKNIETILPQNNELVMEDVSAKKVSIPTLFEVNIIDTFSWDLVTFEVDTKLLEELIQDNKKLISKLKGLHNPNLPPNAIKEAIIKYIDFAKENNIQIKVDDNVQKWYDAKKNITDNNVVIANEFDVIRNGVEPSTKVIYEFDSVKYNNYFGEILIEELLDMIEGKTYIHLTPSQFTTALNELSNYIKKNGLKLDDTIIKKLNQITNIKRSQVVVNPIEVMSGKTPIILNKYVKVDGKNVSTLQLVELISNKTNLVGLISRNTFIDGLEYVNIEDAILELFNISPEISIQYNEVLDLINELKNNTVLYDTKNNTYVLLPKEINDINTETIIKIKSYSSEELNRFINSNDIEILNVFRDVIDSIINIVNQKDANVDVSDLVYLKNKLEVSETKTRNVFGILHKAYSWNQEIGGTYGPEQSAIGIKLSEIDLKSSIETMFKTKMTDIEFFKHLGLDSFTQEKFKKILDKNYRKQNGIFAKIFGNYVNTEVSYQEIQKLSEIVKNNIPGLDDKQAFMFLHYMETGEIGSNGICSYADAASIIINKYLGNPIKFEQDFGFPMYTVNNKGDKIYNYEMLIVDMYSTINKDILLKTDINTGQVIFESTNEKQAYMSYSTGLNEKVLNKYFKDKNIELSLNKTFEFHGKREAMHHEKLLEMIASELQKGNTVHLGAKGFALYNENGNNIASDIGGHAMTVLGINNDGNLVVNSWGKVAIFDLKAELAKAGNEYSDKDANGNIIENGTSAFYIQAFETKDAISEFDGVIELSKHSGRVNAQNKIDANDSLDKINKRKTSDVQSIIKNQFKDLVQYIEKQSNIRIYDDLEFKNKVKEIYKNLNSYRSKSLYGLHTFISQNIGKENASKLMHEIGRELLTKEENRYKIKASDISLSKESLSEYFKDMFKHLNDNKVIGNSQYKSAIRQVDTYSLYSDSFEKTLSRLSMESDFELDNIQSKEMKYSMTRLLMYMNILNPNIDIGEIKIIIRNSESPARFNEKYNSQYSIKKSEKGYEVELWNANISEENIIRAFANIVVSKLSNTENYNFASKWLKAVENNNKISSYNNLISINHDFIESFVDFNKNPRQYLDSFKGNETKATIIKDLFIKTSDGNVAKFVDAILKQDGKSISLDSPQKIDILTQFRYEANNYNPLTEEIFNNYSYEDYHLIFGGFTLNKDGLIYGAHSVSNFVKAVVNNHIQISNYAVHPSFREAIFEYYTNNNPKTIFAYSNNKFLKMYHYTIEKYRNAIQENILDDIGDSQLILLPNGLWIQRYGNINGQSRSFYPIINNAAGGLSQFVYNGKTSIPVPIKINGETKIVNVSVNGEITKEALEYGPKLIQTVRRLVNNNQNINSIDVNELRFNQITETFDIVVKQDSVEIIVPNSLIMNKETAPYVLEYVEALEKKTLLKDKNIIVTEEDILKYSKGIEYLEKTYSSVPTTTLLDFVKQDVSEIAKVLVNKEQYEGYNSETILKAIIEMYNDSTENGSYIKINPNLEHFIKEYQSVNLEEEHQLINLEDALYKGENIIALPTRVKVSSYRRVSAIDIFDIINRRKDISTTLYSEIDLYEATKELSKYFEGKNISISPLTKNAFDIVNGIDENSVIINFIDALKGNEKIVLPKEIEGKYGKSKINDVLEYLNGGTHYVGPRVIESLKEYIDTNNIQLSKKIMDKINLLASLGEDNILINEKAYLKGQSNPIIIPKYLEGIYTSTSKIYDWITGSSELYDSNSTVENIRLTKKFAEYIYSNNIILEDVTMSKLEILRNLKENETILNLQDFFKGESATIIDNNISMNGNNFKVSTILDVVNLKASTYLKILSGQNIDGITRENIFDAIETLYKVNPSLKEVTLENYENIRSIYNNSFVLDGRYVLPKAFNNVSSEFIEMILKKPMLIGKYTIDERTTIFNAIDEYINYLGENHGKYYTYDTKVKLKNNLIDLANRQITDVKLTENVYSPLYQLFLSVSENGGTFGTDQGVIREMLKEVGIKDAIKALFYDEKITDDKFLSDLNELGNTKEKLIQALNNLFNNPNRKSAERLINFIKNNQEISLIQKNYPGMNGIDAIRFLYLVETVEAGNNGVCNYAAAVNMIFNKYIGKEALFEKTFGYPMYITNSQGNKILNDSMLLVDMYSTINKGVLVKEVNGKYEIATTNKSYLNLSDVGRFEMEYLQKFIDAKGIDLGLNETFYYSSLEKAMWKEEIILKIIESLEKGEYINISGAGFDLLRKDGSIACRDCGGHIMTLVGLTTDGKVIVDSWGQELVIDLEATMNHLGEDVKIDGREIERRLAIASYELTDESTNIENKSKSSSITQELETFDTVKDKKIIDESRGVIELIEELNIDDIQNAIDNNTDKVELIQLKKVISEKRAKLEEISKKVNERRKALERKKKKDEQDKQGLRETGEQQEMIRQQRFKLMNYLEEVQLKINDKISFRTLVQNSNTFGNPIILNLMGLNTEIIAPTDLLGEAFENYLVRYTNGKSTRDPKTGKQMKMFGLEYDGNFEGYFEGKNIKILWEAKSGNWCETLDLKKFSSSMGNHKRQANDNGYEFELVSNTTIRDDVKEILEKQGIPYTELCVKEQIIDEGIADFDLQMIDVSETNKIREEIETIEATRPQIQTENVKQLSILENVKHILQKINDKFTGYKISKSNNLTYYERTTKSNNNLFKQKQINKTFRDFLNKHLIDLESLKENGLLRNPKISEINSLITNNRVLTSMEDANVSVADIIGTKKNIDLDKNFNLLFNEGSGEFQTRDLGLLEYTSDQILNVLSQSFENHPIIISEVDTGKYIIEENGYHRYSILRLHYLNEYVKVKDNPTLVSELNKKYQIPVKVYKLDTTKTYCTSLLKKFGIDIKVKTSSVIKQSKIFIDGKKVSMSDAELIEFTKNIISSNSDSVQIINKMLSESVSFKEFYNKYLDTESNDYGIESDTLNTQIEVNNKTYSIDTIIDILNNKYLEIFKGRTIDGINSQNMFVIINKAFESNSEIKNKYKDAYDNMVDIFKTKYVHENGNLYPKTFNFIKTEDIIEILKQPYKLQRYSKEKRYQINEAINRYVEYAISNNYDLTPKEYKGYSNITSLMSRDVTNVKLTSEVGSKLLNEFRKNVDNYGTFGSKQSVIRNLLERNGITNAINYLFNKEATGTKFLEQIKDFTDEDFQDLLDSVVDETGKLDGLYNLYDEYELFDLMRNNFEDIEDFEIIKFLYLFESTEAGAKGICNYSVAVNMIFNKYLGKEVQFKKDFGYPMYVIKNGKKVLNDTMLLVDMYSTINKEVFTKEIDGVVKVIATNNKNYLPVTNPGGSFNLENLNKFLNKKGIKLDLNKTFAFDSRFDTMWKEEILSNIKQALEKGESVNLSAQGFDLYRKDGKTLAAKDFEGHAMTVVGLTKDGNLIVDSHGMEMIVNLDLCLENAGKVYIDKNKSIKTRRIGITTYSFDSSVPSSNQNVDIIDVSDTLVNKEADEGIFDVFSKPTGDIDLFKDVLLNNKLDTLTETEITLLIENINKGKIKLKDYNLSHETISVLIDKVPLKKIFPISNVTAIKTFIDYFGVETLVEFDKLNNGFLFGNKGENLYSLFDFYDLSIPKTNETNKLKEFYNLITTTINTNKKTEYKTYRFNYAGLVGSEFSKTHPELFLDEIAPQDLKDAFYNGLVNSSNEYKSEWSHYLEGKNVKGKKHKQLISYEDAKIVEKINTIGENSNKYEAELIELANRLGMTTIEVQDILKSKLIKLIENSHFGVRRTLKSLDSILETGKLKNQFEVNHSSYGVANIDMRMDMEKDLFGIPRNLKYEDRPIYGMLLPKDLNSKYVHKGPGSYYSDGNGVIYIFDKSKIINNTTLTLGDSIDQASKICATNLSDPEYFGMFSEILSTIKTKQDLLNFEFTSLYEKTVLEMGNSAYYEFQLHGSSSHTLDNLKEILFLKMPEATIINKLEEKNIKWRVIDQANSKQNNSSSIKKSNIEHENNDDYFTFKRGKFNPVKQLSEYYGDAGKKINTLFLKGKTTDEILRELIGIEKIKFQKFLQETIEGQYLSRLSKEEMRALNLYTRENYTEINYMLRYKYIYGRIEEMEAQTVIDNVDSAISKYNGLEQDMKIYRAVDVNAFIHQNSTYRELFKGIKKYKLDEVYGVLKTLEGKEFSDLGYMSSSPLYDTSFAKHLGYPIVLEINAPKGTQCAYINQISQFYNNENEILFARNTKLQIIEVLEPEEDIFGLTKIIIKCIVKANE